MKRILSVLLVALMLIGMLPMHALHAHAAETVTESLAIQANAGKMSGTASISWSGDTVTFTNYKASSSTAIRTSDSDHYRVYGSSEVEISAPGNITKIVITSTASSYVTPWINSAKTIGTATNSGNVITVVPNTPAETIKFAATAQVRLNKVEVTYEAAGGATECEHINTTENSDGYAATCTEAGKTNSVTCDDCGETVTAQTDISPLGHNYVDGACDREGCNAKLPVVSFSVPSQVAAVDSRTADENTGKITLPAAADYNGKYSYTFMGWAESSISTTETAPTLYTANSQYTPAGDITLYAVYTYTVAGTGGSTEYVLTDASNINPGDTVVITTTKDNGSTYYAMSNGNGTTQAPTATKVTVSGGKLADSNDLTSLKWDIGGSKDAYIFYVSGSTSSWLYCTSTNNGVRVGTNTANTFKIDASSGYLYHIGTSRYIGIYNSADWRCYTSVNANITGQELCFFVQTSGGTDYYTSILENVDSSCTHTNTTETKVDATCTDAGSVTVTCDDCGAVIRTQEIPANGHTVVTDEAKAPTCVNTGLTEGSHCSVCEAVLVAQQPVSATGVHNFVDGACSVCGEAEPTTGSAVWQLVTDVNDLKAGDKIVIVAKAVDYALGTTQNNNNRAPAAVTKDTDTTVTFDDTLVQVITLETGNVSGTFAFYVEGENTGYLYAASAGSNYLRTKAELDNNGSWLITIDSDGVATVKAQGSNTRNWLRYNSTNSIFSCYGSGQGDILIYKETVLCEHKNIVDVAEVPATCTTVGYTAGKKCADCGTYTDGHELIEMISHSYNSGEQTTAPGCETTGVMTYTCTACGTEKTETIAANGHTMGEGVVVEATCEKDGSKTFTCTVCFEKQVETIPATGHSWNGGVVTTPATCETAGEKTYTCANAGCTKTETINALGHAWDEGTQTKDPTCEEPGVMSFTCANDPAHTKDEEIAKQGHSYNSQGVCIRCGEEVSRFQMVTDYKDILAGGQFVLAIKNGDSYYALGQLENGTMQFGSDMPGVIVTVNGTGADSWVEWTETVPVWDIDYYIGGQNSFTISSGGKYLNYGGSGTSFGTVYDTPYQWVFVNKDAQGNNETDDDYAVIAEDGVVSFYTAAGANSSRSINLYSTSDVKFRMYSNNNNFDTVCFFKVVKAADENCTVRFMENGTETMTQTVENGEIITLPAPMQENYPDGYTSFVGWVTLPCEETLIAPTDIYYVSESAGDQNTTLQITDDVTLYALYSRTDPDAEGQSMSYHRVTDESQIAVGQYYIIVGYDEANDKWFAMSLDQYDDARGGSWITPDENGVIQIVPNDRVASFHLEQGVNIGSYGFFDVVRNQFLSSAAATEENNSLRSSATLGESESFMIQINDDGSYSIISQTKDGVDYLVLYNTNDNKNPLFSCYDSNTGIDQTKTYLYVGQTNAVPGTYYTTNGHIHDYRITAQVEASCTTAGYTQYTCSVCGDVKMENVVAHGHTLGEATVIDPTCTEAGSSTSTCTLCGNQWVETIPAQGHNMESEAGYNEKNVPCIIHKCSRCSEGQTIVLKYTAANVVLENTLIVNFWTPANISGTAQYAGFENISATFTYGNRVGEYAITVDISEAEPRENTLVFPCRYITPSQIGDAVTATLTGTYQGESFTYTMEYGVADYCYSILNDENTTDSKLRTLLVDLLYYCDAARTYTTYKADESVTAALTEEQKAERTTTDPELSSVLDAKYAVVENAKASWKSASLIMAHATRMRFRFETTADISTLTVKAIMAGEEQTAYIEEENGQYFVYVDDLSAFEMRETVYITLYEGDTAVSNTVTYSIESYAYSKQNDADVNLAALVKAMMRYGDSAIEYRN